MAPPIARAPQTLVIVSVVAACHARQPPDWRPTHDARTRLSSEFAESGELSDRLARPDLADLVLLYGAESGGALGPCGCDTSPRGGLARIKTYADATHERSPRAPVWLVDAGGWLDATLDGQGEPRMDAVKANDWMVRGMGVLEPTALNVSWTDLHSLTGFSTLPNLPLVSAHIEGAGIVPFVESMVGDQRVVFTGIAHEGPTMLIPEGYAVGDPVDGVQRVLETANVGPRDLVVLLSSDANGAGSTLAKSGLVDLVIDARQHRYREPPFRVGDAVWVKAHHQTLRLGEIRLDLQEGRVTRALDRKIDLDPAIPGDARLERWAKDAEQEVKRVREAHYGF
jgi:hypothetical protein